MNYKCSYNNSTFPYNRANKNSNNPQKSSSVDYSVDNFSSSKTAHQQHASNIFSSFLNNALSPIEKAIGRKINFDDLLLIALIYLLYTEKDNENNLLLLCLIFLLF